MRRVNWWFWLPFLGGALLRLAWVWVEPLWYDENFSLAVARLPWPDMMLALRGDVHPPLYYLLVRPLALLDLPAWTLRLPSVALGIASLPIAWDIFGRLGSEQVRRVAFLLFSLGSSAIIFYSQEARMYALLTFLLLAAVWCLLTGRWVLLCVLSVLLLYTHNYALLYVPTLWLAGMVRNRSTWKALTISLGLAGLAYLPWIPILRAQIENLSSGYWIPPFTVGVALTDLYHSIIQRGEFRMEVYGTVILFGWVAWSFWWYLHHRPAGWLAIVTLAFGTWSLSIAATLLMDWSIMHYRSLVPCAPFLLYFLSAPLVSISTRRTLLTMLLLLPMLVVSTGRFVFPGLIMRSVDSAKMQHMLTIIESAWQPGDVIYHVGDGSWLEMTNYTAHPESHYKMPMCGPVYGSLSPLTRRGMGEIVAPLEQIPWRRAWIITAVSPMTPACEVGQISRHLQDTPRPVFCSRYDIIVESCLYLVEQP